MTKKDHGSEKGPLLNRRTALLSGASAAAIMSTLPGAKLAFAEATDAPSAEPSGEMRDLVAALHEAVDADATEVQEIYKDLHAHPELGFMETRTAGVVAKELQALGFEVKTGIGVTGVVGILQNGDGPVFMYRGDMDALPIEEQTGLPYASTVRVTNLEGVEVPVSHMCGHDANTTLVVAVGKALVRMKDRWSGTLVLVAQPAEEPIEGAKAMIDDGLYTAHGVPEPDYFMAMHTGPLPTGTVVLTGGRLNTGSQHIDVTFFGSGGHGSSPHVVTDPIAMAGAAMTQYQTIVSRMMDPTQTSVLTIGMVKAGETYNVIPTEAHLKIKLHYETVEAGEKMVSSIRSISENVARSFGISSDDMMPRVDVRGYAPPVVNSRDWMARIADVLRQAKAADLTLDAERAIEAVALFDLEAPASDDAFALIDGIDGVQGAYIFIGAAPPDMVAAARADGHEYPFFVHQPNYIVDPDAITFGTKVATVIALDALGK
ncbi:amidohydrolase [Ruegeria pomeroyi]|uniref:Amidohydrolase n=1 Tax=Ruegeria alba TaxID=2916756 RepID=A0ABS9P2H0_9RHOB|nr:amidohydrolase [Ruegeria alba]MCE8515027.1 amidohydrolase [Ruegeria pomeroyi]MCE8522716.1 amidohydrolase [Ruegeria pomeroyi]MCG6560675.1 amidohydrolase [Ruegeria alba]